MTTFSLVLTESGCNLKISGKSKTLINVKFVSTVTVADLALSSHVPPGATGFQGDF